MIMSTLISNSADIDMWTNNHFNYLLLYSSVTFYVSKRSSSGNEWNNIHHHIRGLRIFFCNMLFSHLFFDHVLHCAWMIHNDDHLYKCMIYFDAQQTLIQHYKS